MIKRRSWDILCFGVKNVTFEDLDILLVYDYFLTHKMLEGHKKLLGEIKRIHYVNMEQQITEMSGKSIAYTYEYMYMYMYMYPEVYSTKPFRDIDSESINSLPPPPVSRQNPCRRGGGGQLCLHKTYRWTYLANVFKI